MERIDLAVFLDDEVTHHALPSGGRVTLGRAPECDIQIDDASVSRRHAVLHLGPTMRVEDMGSANGTCVRRAGGEGGAEVETYKLRRRPGETVDVAFGDRILLGAAIAVLHRAGGGAVSPAGTPGRGEAIIARDPAMRSLYDQARRAAQALIGVLLLGETGVGKEVLAHEIHRLSPRAAGPFLALHCGSLAESLLEGELFGHEKGSFTGAVSGRPGLFEAADGGTLLLDEIGELTKPAQVKLLRVIEERSVLRIGARAPKSIDVRILAATSRDLEKDVAQGAFRQDLFYRLSGITLTIPPLRQRVIEIEPLARLFLEAACRKMDQARAPALSKGALDALVRYAWPGNLRELRNAMERAAVLCDGQSVLLEHLPARIGGGEEEAEAEESAPGEAGPRASSIEAFDAEREAFLKQRIIEALEECGGNQTRAAELVGVSRRTLVSRMKEYGLPRPRKKG